MKTLVIAALVVICCLCHRSAGQIAPGILLSSGCCDKNTTERVPLRCITYMGKTPRSCSLKSVIIKTVCNKQICVDPEMQWVKDAESKFQKSTANNKPPSAPFNVAKCAKKRNKDVCVFV